MSAQTARIVGVKDALAVMPAQVRHVPPTAPEYKISKSVLRHMRLAMDAVRAKDLDEAEERIMDAWSCLQRAIDEKNTKARG